MTWKDWWSLQSDLDTYLLIRTPFFLFIASFGHYLFGRYGSADRVELWWKRSPAYLSGETYFLKSWTREFKFYPARSIIRTYKST